MGEALVERDDDVIEGELISQSTALAVASGSGLLPTVSPENARESMRAYQELCEAVLNDDDYQDFEQWDPKTRKKVKKKFKKKSAVKKLQTFWGVTVTAPEAVRDDIGDGHFGFRVRAVASKGDRVVEAWGACSTQEERFDITPKEANNYRSAESPEEFEARRKKALARAYHDVLSTAETRATNRAVMNLIGVGGGEVTADEMSRRPSDPKPADKPAPAFDRERAMRRIFALINEFAAISPDGQRLKDDATRHHAIEQLYAKRSFNDLTDEQLTDFERRVRSQLEKARQ